MNTKIIILATAIIIAVGVFAYTQFDKGSSDSMPGMEHSTMAPANAPASTKAYETAMAIMIPAPTGKPEVDFVQGIIRIIRAPSTWPKPFCNTAKIRR